MLDYVDILIAVIVIGIYKGLSKRCSPKQMLKHRYVLMLQCRSLQQVFYALNQILA